jgi:hypothetical protein
VLNIVPTSNSANRYPQINNINRQPLCNTWRLDRLTLVGAAASASESAAGLPTSHHISRHQVRPRVFLALSVSFPCPTCRCRFPSICMPALIATRAHSEHRLMIVLWFLHSLVVPLHIALNLVYRHRSYRPHKPGTHGQGPLICGVRWEAEKRLPHARYSSYTMVYLQRAWYVAWRRCQNYGCFIDTHALRPQTLCNL